MKNEGTFRFTYFTPLYRETTDFYKSKLELELKHSWDRNDHDKGALFQAGKGCIEVLHLPEDTSHRFPGLDYRKPQGVFMGLQIGNADALYRKYKEAGLSFHEELADQPWGHRSFYIMEPNGLILFFYQEVFLS